jgi:hypothetical protein
MGRRAGRLKKGRSRRMCDVLVACAVKSWGCIWNMLHAWRTGPCMPFMRSAWSHHANNHRPFMGEVSQRLYPIHARPHLIYSPQHLTPHAKPYPPSSSSSSPSCHHPHSVSHSSKHRSASPQSSGTKGQEPQTHLLRDARERAPSLAIWRERRWVKVLRSVLEEPFRSDFSDCPDKLVGGSRQSSVLSGRWKEGRLTLAVVRTNSL